MNNNTYPVVSPTLMELTPCQVKWKGPTDVAFTDLGGTLGNVKISTKYSKAEIKADQLGGTVLDRRVSGFSMSVTTEMAEVLNKTLLQIIFPHGVLNPSGTKAFDFKTNVGDGDLSNAGVLVLHPLSHAPTDVSFDFTCFKACASAESEFDFSPTEQIKAKIVWNVLPDMSVVPARFARIGDTGL